MCAIASARRARSEDVLPHPEPPDGFDLKQRLREDDYLGKKVSVR